MRNSSLSRRMFLGGGAAVAVGAAVGAGGPAFAATAPRGSGGLAPFGPVLVTDASVNGSYARAVRLTSGAAGRSKTLLATYQAFGTAGFPLYRSDDQGRTWSKYSTIPVTGVALQPYLYELPRAFAGLPKGALLFACNNFGTFTSTEIQLYASTDRGLTWTFLSTVARGGRPDTTNGATPVWEPFLLLHEGRLICYYSDQRDPKFGQKLAHQTSRDLRTWGPVVDDATGTAYAERPGMTTIARIRGDRWIMTYEFGEPDDPANPDQDEYSYHVHYRIAKDPEEFRFAKDTPLLDENGGAPNGAPVVSWADDGTRDGVIIVTGNDDQDLFINHRLGDPRRWTRLATPIPAGYSRQTIPLDGPGAPGNRGLVFVITGAQYGESAPIEAGVVSVRG
ncbi:sialidase family protein [Amnibacterium setariae]|uniref:sialidase family protein n=1 Tax=Amnibacterium setariae TaxID=2306585 RepID=UPI0018F59809|nr:sialidase family protein [Amnibacterium setariae]